MEAETLKEQVITGELREKIADHLLKSLEHPSNKTAKTTYIANFTDGIDGFDFGVTSILTRVSIPG